MTVLLFIPDALFTGNTEWARKPLQLSADFVAAAVLSAWNAFRHTAQKVGGMKLQPFPVFVTMNSLRPRIGMFQGCRSCHCYALSSNQCSCSPITSDREAMRRFTHQSPKAMILQSHPTLDVSFSHHPEATVPVWKPKHSQYSGFETKIYPNVLVFWFWNPSTHKIENPIPVVSVSFRVSQSRDFWFWKEC